MADAAHHLVAIDPARGCETLAELARASAPGAPSSEAHISARARFMDALDARQAEARRKRVGPSVALLQAAIVAFAICFGGLMLWSALTVKRLSYVVEGENLGSGAYVRSGGGELRVLFSEGSELRFGPGSAGELAELSTDGARIVAHDGVLRARIQRAPDADWSFDAGPYSIRVTGTEFSLAWSPTERRLIVELLEGSLLVRGPEAPSGVVLSAGERLVGREGGEALSITPLGEPGRSRGDDATSAEPTATVAARLSDRGVDATAQPPKEAPSSWSELVAAGRFAEVVADAESVGLEGVLAGRPLADLMALADAARYAKRPNLAEQVLRAERRRFPESAQATTAGFLLGRFAEARGATAEALQWYRRYRIEAPSGALAEEALGRLMVLLAQSGAQDAARAAAAEYLASYPAGASSGAAKTLLGQHSHGDGGP